MLERVVALTVVGLLLWGAAALLNADETLEATPACGAECSPAPAAAPSPPPDGSPAHRGEHDDDDDEREEDTPRERIERVFEEAQREKGKRGKGRG